jgi:hypothetical protein
MRSYHSQPLSVNTLVFSCAEAGLAIAMVVTAPVANPKVSKAALVDAQRNKLLIIMSSGGIFW